MLRAHGFNAALLRLIVVVSFITAQPPKLWLTRHIQVSVTRNWWSHDSGQVAVAECTRVMKSLVDILTFTSPVADAETTIALVQGHVSSIESSLSSMSAELSIAYHASLIFMRALDQLRIAASQSSTLVDKESKEKFSLDSDVVNIIEAIKPTAGKLSIMCELVQQGRNYMFHGADSHRSFSLLLCTCAVAELLRLLYKDVPQNTSSNSPKMQVSDAASSSESSPGSLTPKEMESPSVCPAPSFTPVATCEASAMQLMLRMGVCNPIFLLQKIAESQSKMRVSLVFTCTEFL
jgi:hypothetical protein